MHSRSLYLHNPQNLILYNHFVQSLFSLKIICKFKISTLLLLFLLKSVLKHVYKFSKIEFRKDKTWQNKVL